MKLFWFEWKKIVKNRTVWVLLVLSILAITGVYFFYSTITNNVQKNVINKYDFLINLYLQDAEDWALEKERALIAEDKELIEEATMMEESSRFSHESYKNMKESYLNGEWKEIHKRELDFLKPFAYPPPEEPFAYFFEGHEISNFTLRATYEERKYMLEHQINPFVQNTILNMFLPTIYEDLDGLVLELWQDETKRYGTQGVYFIYQLTQFIYIPIVILIGCFIFGNSFSSETTKKKNGIRFYQVLPLNQSKLFFAKFASGYIGTLLFLFIMIGIPLLVGSIMNGFGDLDYPILVYDGYTSEDMYRNAVEDKFYFITLREYLIQTLLISIVMSLIIYSLYYLVSQFSKEPIFNVIIVGIFSSVGTLFSHPYNPFSYMDTDKVITHEIQLQTWNTDFTYLQGLIVTLVISLILVILNFIILKFRSKLA